MVKIVELEDDHIGGIGIGLAGSEVRSQSHPALLRRPFLR